MLVPVAPVEEVPVMIVDVVGVAVVLHCLVAAMIAVHVIVVPLVHPMFRVLGLSDLVRLECLGILPRRGWDLGHELPSFTSRGMGFAATSSTLAISATDDL